MTDREPVGGHDERRAPAARWPWALVLVVLVAAIVGMWIGSSISASRADRGRRAAANAGAEPQPSIVGSAEEAPRPADDTSVDGPSVNSVNPPLPPTSVVVSASVAGPADARWKVGALSVDGRPIEFEVVGDGPRRVMWIGGIHGDERQGSIASEQLGEAVRSAGLEHKVSVLIIRDLNPDGSAQNDRCNANGVDLNRNLPHNHESNAPAAGGCTTGKSALSEPEAAYLHKAIVEHEPQLIMVAHGRSAAYAGAPLVDGDGPAQDLAERFAALSGWSASVPSNYDDKSGTLGRWAGDDRQIAVLTLEYDYQMDPAKAWSSSRPAILAVLTP